jgi:fructoselysine-6-P-deglycase FrlB-like protein
MTHVQDELASQPECWERAASQAPRCKKALPVPGERVAIVGCGTSYFMAQAAATLREAAGQGETDAFAASEFPHGRRYDRVVALTRSGTTTEVLDLLARLRGGTRTTAITADPDTPVMTAADDLVVLDFADERSVVQTRFATTALTLLRAHLGLHPGTGSAFLHRGACDATRSQHSGWLASSSWTCVIPHPPLHEPARSDCSCKI